MNLYNDKLYENILDGIKKGLKNAFTTNLYTDYVNDEDISLDIKIKSLKQQIKDLFKEYNRTKPLYIDLLAGDRRYFYNILNREFRSYDVQGYKPSHIYRVQLDRFTINPKNDYKIITFEDPSNPLLDDFINKEDVIDVLNIALKIAQAYLMDLQDEDDYQLNNLDEGFSSFSLSSGMGYNFFSIKQQYAFESFANLAVDLGGGKLEDWYFKIDTDDKTVEYPENMDMLNFYWQRYGGINKDDFRFILDPDLKYDTFESYLDHMPFKKRGAAAVELNAAFSKRLKNKYSERKTDKDLLHRHIDHIIKNKRYSEYDDYEARAIYKYKPGRQY